MNENAFTIELSENKVRIVEAEIQNNTIKVINMGMDNISPMFFNSDLENVIENTAKIVANLIKQLKISKKTIRVVLPDSFSYNSFFEMPDINEKELLSAIKYQADQFIPVPLEQVNIDIEPISKNLEAKKVLALLCASPKKTIEKIEKLAEYIGLYPDTLETETSSIARFINTILKKQKPPDNKNQGFLLVNVGTISTSVYFILEAQGLMTYVYNFKTGLDLFKKELQINMNIDEKKSDDLLTHIGLSKSSSYNLQQILTPSIKSFIVEMEKSINEISKKRKLEIRNIYLMNEAVKIHALDEFIAKYFSIPTSQFNITPYLFKNNVVDFFKDKLSYFVAPIGASI